MTARLIKRPSPRRLRINGIDPDRPKTGNPLGARQWQLLSTSLFLILVIFEDVEIIEILVSSGDTVAREDGLITLETDKAAMDVPSPENGVIEELTVVVVTRSLRAASLANSP